MPLETNSLISEPGCQAGEPAADASLTAVFVVGAMLAGAVAAASKALVAETLDPDEGVTAVPAAFTAASSDAGLRDTTEATGRAPEPPLDVAAVPGPEPVPRRVVALSGRVLCPFVVLDCPVAAL